VEYIFWARHPKHGEPDLILIFRDHVHGLDDLLLVVEAKLKSGKSGTDEKDQLARYFKAINFDIENLLNHQSQALEVKKDILFI